MGGSISDTLSLPGSKNDPFFGGAAAEDNEEAMEATLAEWDRARTENIEKFDETKQRLEPWIDAENKALGAYMGQVGLSDQPATGDEYKDTPGYRNLMASSRQGVEETAGRMGGGVGERRMAEAAQPSAGMSNQYYNNYMNALSSIASPTTSTNVGSLGMNQAATLGTIGGGVYGANSRNSMASSNATADQRREMVGGMASAYGESQ